MLTIRNTVVKNMEKITLIMVAVILFLSTIIQIFNVRRAGREDALQVFGQIGQILDENSRELERVRTEYASMCLNDARAVAYILEHIPEARNDSEELKKIAANAEVDEIHIFDTNGVIVAGTHPEYFGFSFDSGEQIGFFKPLLTDQSLELVQPITPNTAESKPVQYSALWSEDKSFILQIGMYPSTVLHATEKNELSYIFSLLRTGIGYSLYAIDPQTEKVVGATVVSDVDKDMAEVGFQMEQLESGSVFHAKTGQTLSFCLAEQIGGNYIVWAAPVTSFYRSIVVNELLLLVGLILISVILSYAVANAMKKTVIDQIKIVNEKLSEIRDGNLKTKIDVQDSKEFSELSAHINSVVDSLLQSTEKLEMGEKINSQNEELERQREQLEIALERAEAANEAKSEFLFNMSHDIRTPMNAIIGFTNLALESGDSESQREYLKNIDVSSHQLLDLMNNILELSRIENHKIMIEENLVDVKETYHKLCTIFDSDFKKKHLTRTVEMDIQHPYMYVDTTHYAQIFLNIVSNAVKFTPNGGKIKVSFRELPAKDSGACFMETVIEDTGIGMSSEFLAHAYESFSRERTSTISGVQGTGLGLAIVKNLVDLMGGAIDLESRQGKGTKVTIRLPHKVGEAPGTVEKEEPEAVDCLPFEGLRALMAEDIDINAMIATKLLTSRGFRVERAKDGVDCVDMLLKAENGYYDLVLMDIQMPQMDGYTATRAIRTFEDAKKASIPIIAMTANAFQEDKEKAVEAGMDGHIAKPLDAAKMFETIAGVLKKKSA